MISFKAPAAKFPLTFTRDELNETLLAGLVIEIVGVVESRIRLVVSQVCCASAGNPRNPTQTLREPWFEPRFTVIFGEV